MAELMHELIDAVAAGAGERVALSVAGTGCLTYRELSDRGRAIAAGLRGRGVRAGDLVALQFATPSWLDYYSALLGTLQAGAAAVVISDGATADELRHIAGHCSLRAVLTDRPRTLPDIADWQAELSTVEHGAGSGHGAGERRSGEEVALILHTSGTTGRAKGVPFTHAQLVSVALGGGAKEVDAAAERVLAPFPIASAAGQMICVRELGRGNTLHLIPEFDADRFCAIVERERIERVNLAPAMGHWLARSGQHLTTRLTTPVSVTFSSAPLPVGVLGEMRTLFPNARLENLYSSTEIAPALVTTVVDPERPGSVGKPMAAFELRITDAEGVALPPGERGEVRLRVPGMAGRRYLGDDAASARTFDGDWVRTGDIGYTDDQGYLYLVDRASDVLNPGGRKVAPSEVEAVLEAHPAVLECAVFGLPHPLLDQLVAAAVVTRSPVSAVELRRYARERLSEYKVPAAVYFVESLPRNEIGKVQRGRIIGLLPSSALPGGPRGEAGPRGDTERRLAGLWRAVLDLATEPDGQSNFFAVGGHSLVITELVRAITAEFGITPSVRDLFEHATLSEQAEFVEGRLNLPEEQTERAEVRSGAGESAVWSAMQEYMWAAKERCPNPGWNVLIALRLSGLLEVSAVREALAFLVRRHEVLRTRLVDGVQRVDEPGPVELAVTEVSGAAELAAVGREQHRRCVDLRHGPVLLARLVRLAADEHVLLLTLDHASCDGVSAGILVREFAVVLDAVAGGVEPERVALPALPVRYRDVAAHQRALAASGGYEEDLAFWQRQLAGLPTAPLLPRRPGAPAEAGYTSGLHPVEIEPELAAAVRKLAADTGRTVFLVLLGSLVAALAEVCGRGDVVVATLSAGRHQPEVAGVVGMFANPLLVRVDVAAAPTRRALFDAVCAAAGDAHDHERVPFPLVAERIGPGAARPEVWFNMAPPMSAMVPPRTGRIVVEAAGIPRNYVIEVPAAGWRGENLLVNGVDTGEAMSLELDHNTELVDPATIDRLGRRVLELLRTITTEGL